MDFEYDETAVAMGQAVASITDDVDAAVVREAWRGEHASTRRAWTALAQTGLPGLRVLEDRGGLGLDELAAPIAFEALGRCGLAVPAVETTLFAAPLLARSGSPLLAGVLSGESLVTAVGESGLAPHGSVSDLVVRQLGDVVEIAPTASCEPAVVSSVDCARDLVRIGETGDWTRIESDSDIVARARAGAVVATSAVLVGLASRLLDMTIDYVRKREQFGRKIGSFQAIKHHLADAYLAVESARPCVHAAAWYLARERADADRWVSAAKVATSDAAYSTCRLTLQAHGAIGYTTEYDHHLFAKRVWALRNSWGTPSEHRAAIRRSLELGSDSRK
jgi:alkylation response protein AidB-like acyl-CoA dehydrogenase